MMAAPMPVPNSRPSPFLLPNETGQIALLMIDFQGDFCDDEGSFLAAMGASGVNIRKALGTAQQVLQVARNHGSITVIHTLEAHLPDLSDLTESKDGRSRRTTNIPVIGQDSGNGRMLVRGSNCNGLRNEVAMTDGEVTVHKPGKGAFCDTELRARLEGKSHLIVCGVTTEVCVQTTMREACDRGFHCLVVEDATESVVPDFKVQTIDQMTAFGAIVGHVATSKDVIQALQQLDANSKSSGMPPPSISTPGELPIIDVSPLVNKLRRPFASARRAVDSDCLRCARALDHACRQFGFFYVTGHGVPEPPLDCAQEFFAMELPDKMKLAAAAGEGAGYEPCGAQILDEGRLGDGIDGAVRLGDRKESYIIGKSAPSQRVDASDIIEARWPEGGVVQPGFKEKMIAYHNACEQFLRTLLRGIALGLGMSADSFDCFTKDAMTKLRLLQYPAYKSDPAYQNRAEGCGSHTDWGALTLLAQDDVGGLEVFCHGEWLQAPNKEGAFLVNVGDMLHLWTGERYQSAPHRVVRPTEAAKERNSIAFFYNCDATAPIDSRYLSQIKL